MTLRDVCWIAFIAIVAQYFLFGKTRKLHQNPWVADTQFQSFMMTPSIKMQNSTSVVFLPEQWLSHKTMNLPNLHERNI